jgi:hypothetical protein
MRYADTFVISPQVTLPRAPRSSRPDAHSVTPSALVSPTKSAPTSMASLAATRARPKGTRTPPPTSIKASPGTRKLSSSTSVRSLPVAYTLHTVRVLRPQKSDPTERYRHRPCVSWKAVELTNNPQRTPRSTSPAPRWLSLA